MKMKLRIPRYRLEEGERIPWGYGLAYYDFAYAQAVCYPIPLNLIVNVCRKIYWKLAKPSFPKWESELAKAYQRGLVKGWKLRQERFGKDFEEWRKERKLE